MRPLSLISREHFDRDARRLVTYGAVTSPKRQSLRLGHSNVARIVGGYVERFSDQPRRAAGERIDLDWLDVVAVQNIQPGLDVLVRSAPLPNGTAQGFQHLLKEVRRGERLFTIRQFVLHRFKWPALITEVQGNGSAAVHREAHFRPSWMSCEMVSLRWPLRFKRTRATCRRHCSVSRRGSRSAGTTQATGLLCRVMVVLLPLLARATISQNCCLACATVFVMGRWSSKLDIFAIGN